VARRQSFGVQEYEYHGKMMPRMKPGTLSSNVKHNHRSNQATSQKTAYPKPNAKESQEGCDLPEHRKARVVGKDRSEEKIDLKHLDMLDTKLCLCGQLYGRHSNAYRICTSPLRTSLCTNPFLPLARIIRESEEI